MDLPERHLRRIEQIALAIALSTSVAAVWCCYAILHLASRIVGYDVALAIVAPLAFVAPLAGMPVNHRAQLWLRSKYCVSTGGHELEQMENVTQFRQCKRCEQVLLARGRTNMPTGRPAGLNVDAFVALMDEMGVEAVPLPDSAPETPDDEALPAGDSAAV